MTGFRPDDAAPSRENPLGNPKWPGKTSTNGANWVDYLTYTYNESLVLTANFAVGGATVDERLLSTGAGHDDGGLGGLRAQVEDMFVPLYADTTKYTWDADSSLFVIWIGINDINESIDNDEGVFSKLLKGYAEYIEILYQSGARNFVFMTVPPIEMAPISQGHSDRYETLVAQWNDNVVRLAKRFTAKHPSTTTFLFDAHQLILDVIHEPCTLEESCGLEETIDFCPGYSFANLKEFVTKSHDPECPYSIGQYLWMNPLHITTVAHKMIARAVADALHTPARPVKAGQEHG